MTKIPYDSPAWVEKFVLALQEKAEDMLEKAKTADEALRAAGAHALLKYAGAELEIEASRQESEIRRKTSQMNAR